MAAGRICNGPSTAGAALSILSPPVVTAKLHTGFCKILKQREEVADPAIHQHG